MNNAKIIADALTQVTDLMTEGKISHDLHASVTAALWELATLKDLREEVYNILQGASDEVWAEMEKVAEMAVWA